MKKRLWVRVRGNLSVADLLFNPRNGHGRFLLGALLIGFALVFSGSAFASSSLGTGGVVGVYNNLNYGVTAQGGSGLDHNNYYLVYGLNFPFYTPNLSSSGSTFDTGNVGVSGVGGGEAVSQAGYGNLGAQVSLSATGFANDLHGSIGSAGAAWQDTWSITGAGLPTNGYVTIGYSVNSQMYSPDSAQPARSDAAWFYYISNQTQVNGAGPQLKYAAGTLNYWENITGVMTGVMPTGPASGTFNLNVNFYTPNTIVSALYAYAYVSGGELSLYEQGTNYTVSNDAATIQILGVFDASGNPISNYTLTTGSDYNYASVPLPPSLLLFGPGLVGLAAVRRRFKK